MNSDIVYDHSRGSPAPFPDESTSRKTKLITTSKNQNAGNQQKSVRGRRWRNAEKWLNTSLAVATAVGGLLISFHYFYEGNFKVGFGEMFNSAVKSAFVALGLGSAGVKAIVSGDGVTGRLPPLGWNSWNAFYCDISEEKFLLAGQKIIELGLAEAGYEYVNIDDCWSIKSGRDPVTNRLQPDLAKFPDGINGTAAKIHALGLKIGIYSDAGSNTCAGYPGSLYYEEIDAETWMEWGIDYLKYDNCNVPSSASDPYHACHPDYNHPTGPNATCVNDTGLAPANYDWSSSPTAVRYDRMRDALTKYQGEKTVLYSMCNWGQAKVETWANDTAHTWRITDDIFPYWSRIAHILNYNSFHLDYVDFWGHNDPVIGNGNLTAAETRSHFALWAAMKSPLLIGTSLDTISAENVALLKNKYLLAFNQDPVFGAPAKPYKWGTNPDWTYNDTYPAEFWSGDSVNGVLVLMLNTLEITANKTALWSEIPELKGLGNRWRVTDVWTGQSVGCLEDGWQVELETHDIAVGLVEGTCY
ncbi:hypothetical protein RUND412_008530 [Rhizina undulata]